MRGAAIRYSAAELEFVAARRGVARRALHADFVLAFGRGDVKVEDIKALCTRNGWTTRVSWTEAGDTVLRFAYPDVPTEQLAGALARPVSSIYQRARKLGLAKSAAYLASPAACRLRRGDNVGAPYRFTKGHAPANKGLRRPGWAPGRMRETQFQKGVRRGVAVKLYKPIGTERVSREGYLERKIHDGMPLQSRWRAVHLIRWEAINGPVPAGMVLKRIGAEKQNADPSNWMLIPRAILPRLNGGRGGRLAYDDAPAELKPTILAAAQLVHAARERGKARTP